MLGKSPDLDLLRYNIFHLFSGDCKTRSDKQIMEKKHEAQCFISMTKNYFLQDSITCIIFIEQFVSKNIRFKLKVSNKSMSCS